MGCCPKWPCWLSKDLLGISKGKLVYCGEVSVCLHQQFVVYFPSVIAFRQELKELQRFHDQFSTLLNDAKGQSCSMLIRLAGCTLFYSSVQIFFIKVSSKAEPQKEILSEKTSSNSLWCSVLLAVCSDWTAATLRCVGHIGDLLKAYTSVSLFHRHPSIKKGQQLCKKMKPLMSSIVTPPEMMETHKLDFAS